MSLQSTDSASLIILGHITGTHGLQGWVKVHSDTQPRTNITHYRRLFLQQKQAWQAWQVTSGRQQGKYILLKLAGCSSCNQAEALVGAQLAIASADLSKTTEPGQFYWADLIGLAVINTQGESLGVVDHLLETGVHDVLVLIGDQERLIPFVWEKIIKQVDLSTQQIQVDWGVDF